MERWVSGDSAEGARQRRFLKGALLVRQREGAAADMVTGAGKRRLPATCVAGSLAKDVTGSGVVGVVIGVAQHAAG
jgi:hypothetical protein